jgi:hypothetical protein
MQRHRSARFWLLPGAVAAAVTLAGCGGGRGGPDNAGMVVAQRPDGTRMAVRSGRDPNAAYVQATELKAKGDCPGAIVLLRPIAALGPGYETAQTVLGECLIAHDESRDDGLLWLTRAADAGWPEAQAVLASHYSTAGNGEEAAFWLALYDGNPTKARIGFRPFDAKSLQRIRQTLDPADQAAGAQRAAKWERKVWLPPPPSPGAKPDGPGLRPAETGRGSGLPPRF